MLRPGDTRARLSHLGFNLDDFTPATIRDIAHDIKDDYPLGYVVPDCTFRRIAERNRRDA